MGRRKRGLEEPQVSSVVMAREDVWFYPYCVSNAPVSARGCLDGAYLTVVLKIRGQGIPEGIQLHLECL
jgi:hypothetical protein